MSASNKFFGEKYEQLVAVKPIIESAGFGVPEMYGLPQNTIDKVLYASSLPSIDEADHSGLDRYEAEDRITLPDDLSDHLLEMSRGLAASFAGPLLMRSSGRGDAIGVGVYSSEIYSDNIESVRRAFSEVVASYFSKEAITYRQRARIASGFAVLMQPLVGTTHEGVSRYGHNETAQIFDTFLSGNAKIGTPRSPLGSMKLQPGFGCAVDIPGLPSFEFRDKSDDDKVAEWEASEAILKGTNPRNRGADDAVSGRKYVNDGAYGWRQDYGEFYPKNRVTRPETFTIGALKEQLTRVHSALGSRPSYYEFVVRLTEEGEELYVVQKGDLSIPIESTGVTLDTAKDEDILLTDMVVEAGNGNSPTFGTIVCLTDEDKSDLYAFDETEAAQSGYLLAFGAQSSMKRNPVNVRMLKNVKAIVTLESMSWSHTSNPEEHVAGYSEALGIPLISISNSSGEAWRLLNGYSYTEHKSKGRHEGTLIVRDGSFQVVTDAHLKDGLILEFGRED
jgi:hypothetical protein